MSSGKFQLNLLALVAFCIGPMVGAGLYALPQNIAQSGGLSATLIALTLTCLGTYCLVRTFQFLSSKVSPLESCLYTYAKHSCGNYMGFNAAWGYWVSSWTSNIAYLFMLCSTLSFFFPSFEGSLFSLQTLIVSSLFLWLVTILCFKGIKISTYINIVATLLKILPILFFIALCLDKFNFATFKDNLLSLQPESLFAQVKKIMLVTAWIFVGIEGAVIFSSKAKKLRTIGLSTLISFSIMSVLYYCIALLPFGITNRATLSSLPNPPLTNFTVTLAGHWSGLVINLGLFLSILGAFFAWLLLAAEASYTASKLDNLFPLSFQRENRHQVPTGALLITALCEEGYLLLAYFLDFNYLQIITIAVTMVVPSYLFASLDYLKVTHQNHRFSLRELSYGVGAILYSLWLLYAADRYFIYSSLIYAIGGLVYIFHRRRTTKNPVFTPEELTSFIVIVFIAIISSYLLLG